MSVPKVDPIGYWVLKWVVGPIIAIVVLGGLIHYGVMRGRCRSIATERGYLEARYIPAGRAGFGARCVCQKKKNPDGTVDEKAELVVPLD